MAFEDRIRETSEHLAVRLRAEIDDGLPHLVSLINESLKSERDAATSEARQHAEAEAARTLAEELDRARRHAEAWLSRKIDQARHDAEKQADERVTAARAEGERAGRLPRRRPASWRSTRLSNDCSMPPSGWTRPAL